MATKKFPVFFLLLLFACKNSASELPNDLDDARLGKADSAANVAWEDVDNDLYSASLRNAICQELRRGAANLQCSELSYRVTRVGLSTLIQYSDDQRPVTVALEVDGEHEPTATSFHASLTREIRDDFGLGFQVVVTSDLRNDTQIIEDLADEGGEFPDMRAWEQQGLIRSIRFDDLPSEIQDTFEDALVARAEFNRGPNMDEEVASAMYSEEIPFAEILSEGAVIGYIVRIDDLLDHPLWDGSGITYYFDRFGGLVTSEDWAG